MILLDLFANLSDYSGKPINFSESIVDSLFYLEFEDSGLELKNIIETVYTDGIDGFEDVENDGTKITGVFIDRVSSGLTKRFRFTVTEDNISYKLLNPEDLDDADFAELDFATTPTGKKKNCVKGQACGNTCITKNAECNAKPSREVKNSVKNILAKAAKPPKVAKGSVKQVQEKAAKPPKVAKGSVKQVQEKAAKPPKEPKTKKAKKETGKEVETTKTKENPQTQSKKALSELDFYEQGNVDTLGTGGLGSAYLDKNTRPPTVRKYGYIPEGEVELLEKMGKLGISPKVISKFEEADIDIEADTKYGKPGTYSMEFVEGATLYSKYTANKREIPEDVLENALRSRRIMHEAGLAHGDMHSANIIEGSNGKLAIIDPIYYEGRSSGYENAYKDLFNSSFVDQVYSKSDNSSFADNWNEELDKFKQNQKNDLEKGKPSEEVYKKRISDFYKKLLGE